MSEMIVDRTLGDSRRPPVSPEVQSPEADAAAAAVDRISIVVNGQPHALFAGATVADLLGALSLSGKPVAVEVNRQLVPRAAHTSCRLAEGDRLEIVTLVGGG